MIINISISSNLKVSDLVLSLHKKAGSKKNTLGEYLKVLSVVKDKGWVLDIELIDQVFAHTYRSLFPDARHSIYRITDLDREWPKLKLLTKIKGQVALDLLDDFAKYPSFGLDEQAIKRKIQYSKEE
jgi:hypothetical protein